MEIDPPKVPTPPPPPNGGFAPPVGSEGATELTGDKSVPKPVAGTPEINEVGMTSCRVTDETGREYKIGDACAVDEIPVAVTGKAETEDAEVFPVAPVDPAGTSRVSEDESPPPDRNGIASSPESRYQGENLNEDFFFDEFSSELSSELSFEFTSTFLLSKFREAKSLFAF